MRYDYLVGSDTDVGTWEEYRYDALGRRILTRARRDFLNTPDSSRALCNDPVGGSCGSYIQRSLWDGDQLLYEWRTTEGTPTGMTQGSAGYVHLEGIDQPIGLIRPEGTRVLNYTWRGLGESSVFTNGNSGDCSMFFTGCTPVQWPGKTQAGVYFTPNLLASGPSGPYTWFGTLAENGGGSTGMLFRRNRYFDPVSGRFTQQDPIGVAGGMNLYGFADGDPVNFSDPFGLCPGCVHLGSFSAALLQAKKDIQFEQVAMVAGVTGPLGVARGVGRAVPAVTNSRLGNIVRDLFKGARGRNPIGTGSTADAIRHEVSTGNPVGGTFHAQKGREYLRALEKWLEKNPDASSRDALVARSLRDDLREALSRVDRNNP